MSGVIEVISPKRGVVLWRGTIGVFVELADFEPGSIEGIAFGAILDLARWALASGCSLDTDGLRALRPDGKRLS